MREARVASLVRALVVGVVVWASSVGCGGGTKAPAGPDGGATGVMDTAADAPALDGPPDVREQLLDAAIPCSDGGACAAPATCCNGICVDTSKDPRNCGACGQSCSTSQFCTGTGCTETIVANLCGNPNATVIKDQYDVDNTAAAAMATALMMSCTPPTMVATRDQGEPGVLTPSGRPLAGSGTTYLIGGGQFGQHAVDYLDKTDMTPVFLMGDNLNIQLLNRGTAQVVLSTPRTAINEGHDFFYIQMFVEPLSGTLCVSAVGMFAPGTVAGGFWLSTEIIPKRAMYTDTWYAYEWIDSGDKIPNAQDTFRLVAHGR
jgi:hypothetical protein